MTTLVVVGVFAAGVPARAAAAAVERTPTELWEQFPLEAVQETVTRREQPSDSRRPVAEPALVSRPVSAPTARADEAGETLSLAVLVGGIALVIAAMGAVFARFRVARRRPARTSEQADGHDRRLRALHGPPTAHHEAEQLVQLLSGEAGARGRRGDADAHLHETTGAGLELGDPDETPDILTMKQATSAQFEAEVLKRKPTVDAQILNSKAKREAVALKEKLATAPEQKQRVRAPDQPFLAVPTPEDAEERIDSASEQGRLLACEVRWVPIQKASQFVAVEHGAQGAGSTIAASMPFDWRASIPPPESPAAAAALGGLIDVLLSEGWVATGRGEDWFASKFLLPRNATRRSPR